MKFAKYLLILGVAGNLIACGNSNSSFKSVSIKSYQDATTHNTMVEMSAEVNSANMVFPTAYIPVVDPKNNNKQLGLIRLERTLDGKNMLYISADATGVKLGNFALDSKLPNGNPVPVSGTDFMYGVGAGNGNSKLYVGQYQGKLVVGAAIAVKEFDGLAGYIPGANIFFALPANSGVNGVAGFFTGTQTGTSGVGIFAQTTWANPVGGTSEKISSDALIPFKVSKPSSTKMWYLQNFLWDLNKNHTTLHVK